MSVVRGQTGTLSIGGEMVARVASFNMGFVPPTSPVVMKPINPIILPDMASSAATMRNVQQARSVVERARQAATINRNIAATGREPLPSERKILGERPKRKITLEE